MPLGILTYVWFIMKRKFEFYQWGTWCCSNYLILKVIAKLKNVKTYYLFSFEIAYVLRTPNINDSRKL